MINTDEYKKELLQYYSAEEVNKILEFEEDVMGVVEMDESLQSRVDYLKTIINKYDMAQSDEFKKFQAQLEKDWDNPDICGPWTTREQRYNQDGSLKFFKSYYFITDNSSPAPNIEVMLSEKDKENAKEIIDYYTKMSSKIVKETKEPFRIKFLVPVGQKQSFWSRFKFW